MIFTESVLFVATTSLCLTLLFLKITLVSATDGTITLINAKKRVITRNPNKNFFFVIVEFLFIATKVIRI